MRLLILVLVGLWLGCGVVGREKLISKPSSGVGKWEVDQELDPVNDKQNVFARLRSEDYIVAKKGAVLAITCFGVGGDDGFKVQFLLQGVEVAYEHEFKSDTFSDYQTHGRIISLKTSSYATVIWRFDKLKTVSGEWDVSKDRKMLYPMSKNSQTLAGVQAQQRQWAKDLLGHSKLFVRIKRIKISENKQLKGDFVFDLRGAEQAVSPVLRACGW